MKCTVGNRKSGQKRECALSLVARQRPQHTAHTNSVLFVVLEANGAPAHKVLSKSVLFSYPSKEGHGVTEVVVLDNKC